MCALLASTFGVGKDTVIGNLVGQLVVHHGELAADAGSGTDVSVVVPFL